ncbi:MAG: M4 family metallopeptidase [Rhodoblastus sp.]|nr:MAG: M4 family metallopeptidase [Rhodoblastus sp.]
MGRAGAAKGGGAQAARRSPAKREDDGPSRCGSGPGGRLPDGRDEDARDAARDDAGSCGRQRRAPAQARRGRARDARPAPGRGRGGALAGAKLPDVEVYDLADLKSGRRLAPIDPNRPGYGDFFDLTKALLTFYRERFGRESYDGKGARLAVILNDMSCGGSLHDATVECLRFSETWSGKKTGGVVYEFSGIPRAPDYLAHEFQHAVTCACSSLDYDKTDQAALHESLSDVFAITFRHWLSAQAAPAPIDWRFGSQTAKIVPPSGLQKPCTRNLDAPGDVDAWEAGRSSIGAVTPADSAYAASLVPSHAFRRVTARLGEDKDAAKAIDEAARVWYAALASPEMKNVHTIQAFADLTASAAQALEKAGAGAPPALLDAVRGGWSEVGVAAAPGPLQNPALIAALVAKPTGFA